jgi:hypothetical protein
MQRLIRSFNTLTDELKATLQEQYPDGIDTSHIKSIPTAKGDILRVIELRTPEAMYLIKINAESRAEIDEFLDQEETPGDSADDMDEGDDGMNDSGDSLGSDDADDEDGEGDDPDEGDDDEEEEDTADLEDEEEP